MGRQHYFHCRGYTLGGLVLSLIGDLNDLYATGLCVEPIVDRFMDEEVIESEPEHKMQLLLVGSSHIRCIAEQLESSKWEIFELCSGGFRINDHNVADSRRRSIL